jgi:hypothetical protein
VPSLKYFLNIFQFFFAKKKLKKPPQKVAFLWRCLWQLGGFFSAAPTDQNISVLEVLYTAISCKISGCLDSLGKKL